MHSLIIKNMKKPHYFLPVLFAGFLFSCGHTVKMETVVNNDGSIDRTIILEGDFSEINTNYFGINDESGWSVSVEKPDTATDRNLGMTKNRNSSITYKKHFNTFDESNLELNNENDTLFHIEAKLEKRFRWFYTYLKYSDTYKAIDRFKLLNQADFLTPEDYMFMDRLPAEGDSISKADQLYLEDLTSKINDVLVPRAVFEEHFALFPDFIKKYQLENRWIDTLQKHKEAVYTLLLKDDNNLGDDAFLTIFDSLQIPFPHPQVDEDYKIGRRPIEARLEFMSYANYGKYFHTIQLPGEVIDTNADSLSGPRAIWKPSVYKFIAKDYTMYAETRKLNLWAVIVSVLVLIATVYVFVRK